MLAGDPVAAENELRRDIPALEQMGEQLIRSTLVAALAHVRYALGDLDEAESLSRSAEELAADDDVEAKALWRGVRAMVLARRGELAPAEGLIREALALAAGTDTVQLRTEIDADAAAVYDLVGQPDQAAALRLDAVAAAEAKVSPVLRARFVDLLPSGGPKPDN
jgi:ATP/maltotriose-dependent transcriptional regulator MalT